MTSTSNLAKFKPRYLYIKQHALTGLLYFGQTSKSDPVSYLGSGLYWKRHIKTHGEEHVVTLWYELFTNKEELTSFAIQFSKDLNIVESKSWANLTVENGLYGGVQGTIASTETRNKLHTINLGKKLSEETKAKMRAAKLGKSKTLEHRLNISSAMSGINNPMFGKSHSVETKLKMSRAKI